MAAAEDQLLAKDLHYDTTEVLGRGGYSNVYRGDHETFGLVAVKIFIEDGVLPEREKKALIKEVKKLKQAQGHPYILKMHGYIMEKNNYGLVLEYMHFGSVNNFVRDLRVDIPLLVRIVNQVISAMAYLHGHTPPFIHLDMKADNVLISNHLDAKVSDFGLSEWRTTTVTVTRPMQDSRACTVTHVGPEVFININTPPTPELDVYAFGITLWETFSGQQPFRGQSNGVIREAVLDNQRPDMALLRQDCPMIIKTMIQRCWAPYAQRRPSFSALSGEMEKGFQAFENKVPAALKSIRSQICENFALNDEEYIGTCHLDDLEVPDDEPADDSTVDAAAGASTTPVGADAASAGLPLVTPTPGEGTGDQGSASEPEQDQVVPEIKNPLKLNRRIVPNFRTSADLPLNDKQVRKAIRSPPAVELINTRFCECLVPHRDGQTLLKDRDKMREYFEQDVELQREMMQGNGQFFSCLNSPHFPDSVHRGKMIEHEKRLMDEISTPSRYTSRSSYKREEGEEHKHHRHSTMRCSKYGEKLLRNGLGQKLMKALKEPHVFKDYVEEKASTGEGEKFQMLDPAVVEAAKDPFLVSILLVHDPIALDTVMRYYSDIFMKLLCENKTTYTEERDEPRRMGRMEEDMKFLRGFPDMRRMGRGLDDDDEDRMYGMPSMKHMMGPSEMRKKKDMMKRSMESSWGRERKPPDEKKMKDIEKIIREAQEKQMQKFKKNETTEVKKNETTELKKGDSGTKKKEEFSGTVRPEISRGLENEHEPSGGILSNLAGIFTGSNKKSIFDTMRMRESIPSVDMQSAQVPSSLPSGSHTDQPTPPSPSPGSLKVVPPRPQSESSQIPTVVPPSYQGPPSSSKPTSPPSLSFGKKEDAEHDAAPGTPLRTSPSSAKAADSGTEKAAGSASKNELKIVHNHSTGAKTKLSMTGMDKHGAIQVGDRNVMVVNQGKKSKSSKKGGGIFKKKDPASMELTQSESLLNTDQIDMIASNIGKERKRLCREMGLSDSDIEQIEQDFHINGTYEQMYQAIARWNQRNGRAATVKKMAEFLVRVDRVDLAKQLK